MSLRAITEQSRFLQSRRSSNHACFQPENAHGAITLNHALGETAGRAITQAITPITRLTITFSSTPIGVGKRLPQGMTG
jgi:hypothetical protein